MQKGMTDCVCVVLETFTTGCPGWTDCVNNTVRSFWNRVSTAVSYQQDFTGFAKNTICWIQHD